MARTYTYTARSADNPERVITFTLRDSRMCLCNKERAYRMEDNL